MAISKSMVLRRAAAAQQTGMPLHLDIWAPGDGHIRYTVILGSHHLQAFGSRDALRIIDGMAAGWATAHEMLERTA